jgi:hypothetical protein
VECAQQLRLRLVIVERRNVRLKPTLRRLRDRRLGTPHASASSSTKPWCRQLGTPARRGSKPHQVVAGVLPRNRAVR